MTRKLYVSDLDGTLLNSHAEISEYSMNALNELINDGVHFTVATARSLKSIKKILNGLNLKLPVISFNGGYISDYNKVEHIVVNAIEKHISVDIYNKVSKDFGCMISTYKDKKDTLYYNRVNSQGHLMYIKDREKSFGNKLEQIDAIGDFDVMAFTVIDTKERVEILSDQLRDWYGDTLIVHVWEDMYYKPWYWLTIHSKVSEKSTAIVKLKEMSPYDYDEVIVFGDNINDIDMFKIAQRAYAVKNAVDELKVHATEIIASNVDDGVVHKILELEGGHDDIISK